ncbi:MAG: hypothetical protein Q9226_004203, partial [Calogaya cf. arnoldii]
WEKGDTRAEQVLTGATQAATREDGTVGSKEQDEEAAIGAFLALGPATLGPAASDSNGFLDDDGSLMRCGGWVSKLACFGRHRTFYSLAALLIYTVATSDIAPYYASRLVTGDQELISGDDKEVRPASSAATNILVAPNALLLLNAFLDQLLYTTTTGRPVTHQPVTLGVPDEATLEWEGTGPLNPGAAELTLSPGEQHRDINGKYLPNLHRFHTRELRHYCDRRETDSATQTRDAEAVTEVLKPGLAKDVAAKANTELKDFDGENDIYIFHNPNATYDIRQLLPDKSYKLTVFSAPRTPPQSPCCDPRLPRSLCKTREPIMVDSVTALTIESWTLYAFEILLIAARIISRRMLLGSFSKLQVDDWIMIFVVLTFTGVIVSVNQVSHNLSNYLPDGAAEQFTPQERENAVYRGRFVMILIDTPGTLWHGKL